MRGERVFGRPYGERGGINRPKGLNGGWRCKEMKG